MKLLEDSRQKPDKHVIKNAYWIEHGDEVLRCKIPFGDYCLPPKISIDTKAGMAEIAGNIGGSTVEHNRFREECKLAQRFGCKLVFLIENDDGVRSIEDVGAWENPRRSISPKAINGQRLMKAMYTIQERYGCEFRFCDPNDTGRIINEILEGCDGEG